MQSKQVIISLIIVILGLVSALIITQFETVTPSSHAGEEHGEEENHPEEHKGPHGGTVLGEDQSLQLEIKTVEKVPGQLHFLVYALQAGQVISLEPTALTLTWQRLDEKTKMRLGSQDNALLTQDFINEPHSFELKASLNHAGKAYHYTWTNEEYRLEMTAEQIRDHALVFEKAAPQSIAEEIELPGKIAIDQDRLVHVSPRIKGVVQGVYKHLGEPVQRGELLAVLESRDLGDLKLDYLAANTRFQQAQAQYQLESQFYAQTQALLKALKQGLSVEELHQTLLNNEIGADRQNLIQAYTTYRLAQTNFQRESKLLAQQATTEMDYQLAQKQFQDARSAYQSNLEEVARQRHLRLLDKKLEQDKYLPDLEVSRKKLQTLGLPAGDSQTRYELRSPIQGTMISKHIVRGETLDTDTNAFVIADLSVVWAEMMAAESQLQYLQLGLPVKVFSQDGKKESHGKISHLGSVVDEDQRTAEAHAEILNPDRFWRPGMFTTISLQSNPRQVAVAVKKSALQDLNGEPFVFVRHGEVIQGLPVEVGQENSTWIEIKSGLKPGQIYLSQNSYLIKAELEKSSAAHAH